MSDIVVQGTTPGIRVSGTGAQVTVKVTTGSGGGGGVTDHNALSGRSDPDQHPIGAVTGLQSALDGKADVSDIPDISGLVGTTDPRLSDARTPTAHKSTHATGGTDALAPADIGAAPATHSHAASAIASGVIAPARLGPVMSAPGVELSQPGPYAGYTGYHAAPGHCTWTAQFVPAGTYDRIAVNATAGAATLRLCVDSVGSTGWPAVLLVDGGTVLTSAGPYLEASISWMNPTDQWVWLRCVAEAVTTSPTLTALSGLSGNQWPPWPGFPAGNNAARAYCGVRSATQTTGANQQPVSGLAVSFNSVGSPRMWIRRAT